MIRQLLSPRPAFQNFLRGKIIEFMRVGNTCIEKNVSKMFSFELSNGTEKFSVSEDCSTIIFDPFICIGEHTDVVRSWSSSFGHS